ncbi:MAG: hypothetical protein SGILL_009361 [Bacillariaceae sp.]
MPRLLFGPYEVPDGDTAINNKEDSQALASIHASRTDFMTLRWQWPGSLQTTPNKTMPGKTIVDVSRIPYSTLDFTHIGDPHRPVREYCTKEDVWIANTDSLLVVHHYIGRFDQWSFRSDPRKQTLEQRRTRQQFDQYMGTLNVTRDNSIEKGKWLSKFVRDVGGPGEAQKLLEGVGKVVDLDV